MKWISVYEPPMYVNEPILVGIVQNNEMNPMRYYPSNGTNTACLMFTVSYQKSWIDSEGNRKKAAHYSNFKCKVWGEKADEMNTLIEAEVGENKMLKIRMPFRYVVKKYEKDGLVGYNHDFEDDGFIHILYASDGLETLVDRYSLKHIKKTVDRAADAGGEF